MINDNSLFFEILLEAQIGNLEAQERLLMEFDKLITYISNKTNYDKEDCRQDLSIEFLRVIPKFDILIALNAFITKLY